MVEYLYKHLRGKTIRKFEVSRYRNPASLKRLENCILTEVHRRAKYILFEFVNSSDERLTAVSHMALSGSWQVRKSALPPLHTLFSFIFDDNVVLDYVDPRKFGRFNVYSAEEFWKDKKVQERLSAFGPDVLTEDIPIEVWKERLSNYSDQEIKPALMEQNLVAGIGNIYASEICFLASINPFRKIQLLTVDDVERLAYSAKEILKQAYAKGGSSVRTFVKPDGSRGVAQEGHYVYRRFRCPLCSSSISKAPQKTRTTYWCPKCQAW